MSMGNPIKRPPRLAEWFLEWYCSDQYLEDLQGDLHEYYQRRIIKSGSFVANLMFLIDVLKNCKPFLFERHRRANTNGNNLSMLKNNFKSIGRNFLKHKMYASINIMGLAIGIAGAIFIWQYIKHELSYENFHAHRESIYRVTNEFFGDAGFQVHWARTPMSWVDDLVAELPEVRTQIRFQNYYPRVVKIGERSFKEEHAFSVDSNVFEVFSFNLTRGNANSALQQPFSVVLTEKLSNKYFPGQDPLGKVIQIVNEGDSSLENYKVTGVMKDLPTNTHLPVNLLTSFRNAEERGGWAYNYLQLAEETSIEELEAKFLPLIEKYRGPEARGKSLLHLQQISDIHLHSNLAREIIPNGDIFYVRIFAVVGIFILLMAIINFTNLATSKSLERIKEVGIRKVLGSNRRALFQYFMSESLFYTLISSCLALVLVVLTAPVFKQMSGMSIQMDWLMLGFVLPLVIFTSFFSGIYPAMVMSDFKPIHALKGTEHHSGVRNFSLRKMLIILQFVISLIILSSTLITWEQFEFIQSRNLGLETAQVLAITNSPLAAQAEYENFRHEVVKIPGVTDVTANMEVPSREIRDTGIVSYEGLPEDDREIVMDIQVADSNYIDFMGMKLLAGKNFTPSLRGRDRPPEDAPVEEFYRIVNTSRREYIINETAVKLLGESNGTNVIGRQFSWGNGTLDLQEGAIVGVVKDSHQETLHNKVDPLVLIHEPIFLRTFLVKLETAQVQETLVNIEKVWKDMFPDYPMESAFLDDLYHQLYQSEQRQKEVLSLFSYLVIFITLLGLLGLISFMVQRRIKELAIRKILGASRSSILTLFSKGFVFQALMALAVATPVTFYFMQEWLDGFAYRISISGIEFLLSFMTLVLLLGVIVGIQVGRSSDLNPAEILRYE